MSWYVKLHHVFDTFVLKLRVDVSGKKRRCKLVFHPHLIIFMNYIFRMRKTKY